MDTVPESLKTLLWKSEATDISFNITAHLSEVNLLSVEAWIEDKKIASIKVGY